MKISWSWRLELTVLESSGSLTLWIAWKKVFTPPVANSHTDLCVRSLRFTLLDLREGSWMPGGATCRWGPRSLPGSRFNLCQHSNRRVTVQLTYAVHQSWRFPELCWEVIHLTDNPDIKGRDSFDDWERTLNVGEEGSCLLVVLILPRII